MSERSFLDALSDLGIAEQDFSNHDTWVLFHSLTATHGIVKTKVCMCVVCACVVCACVDVCVCL